MIITTPAFSLSLSAFLLFGDLLLRLDSPYEYSSPVWGYSCLLIGDMPQSGSLSHRCVQMLGFVCMYGELYQSCRRASLTLATHPCESDVPMCKTSKFESCCCLHLFLCGMISVIVLCLILAIIGCFPDLISMVSVPRDLVPAVFKVFITKKNQQFPKNNVNSLLLYCSEQSRKVSGKSYK